jgi:hypothetical protein
VARGAMVAVASGATSALIRRKVLRYTHRKTTPAPARASSATPPASGSPRVPFRKRRRVPIPTTASEKSVWLGSAPARLVRAGGGQGDTASSVWEVKTPRSARDRAGLGAKQSQIAA